MTSTKRNPCDICHVIKDEFKICGICANACGGEDKLRQQKTQMLLCGIECFREHVSRMHKVTMIQFSKRKTNNQEKISWSISELHSRQQLDCSVMYSH
jgi:hypothetical protein